MFPRRCFKFSIFLYDNQWKILHNENWLFFGETFNKVDIFWEGYQNLTSPYNSHHRIMTKKEDISSDVLAFSQHLNFTSSKRMCLLLRILITFLIFDVFSSQKCLSPEFWIPWRKLVKIQDLVLDLVFSRLLFFKFIKNITQWVCCYVTILRLLFSTCSYKSFCHFLNPVWKLVKTQGVVLHSVFSRVFIHTQKCLCFFRILITFMIFDLFFSQKFLTLLKVT